MDLDINMRTSACPYTVNFYGAMFREGDVMICMEVMDISLDKFYARSFNISKPIPEDVLGTVAYSVICALEYLHTKLQVIHRDVKPSNILINRGGDVKICDFGISGYLVDSVAKTIDAGCKPYMAVSIDFYSPWINYFKMHFFSRKESIPKVMYPSTTSGQTFGLSAYR